MRSVTNQTKAFLKSCLNACTKEFLISIATVCVLSTVFCTVASTAILELETPRREALMAEEGPIEMTTVVLYGVCSLLLFGIGIYQTFWSPAKVRLATATKLASVGPRYPFLLSMFVAVFAARELDFHSRWTSIDILKTRFYVAPDISLMEKGVVLLILASITFATLMVFYRYTPMVLNRCRSGRIEGILPVGGVLLVIFSKGIDSGMGSLNRAGFHFGESTPIFLGGMEEFSELLIPFFFIAMLASSFRIPSDTEEVQALDAEPVEEEISTDRLAA